MKKIPDVTISVAGQDCTGRGQWNAAQLRRIAAVFLEAAIAIDNRQHGYVEAPNLVHIGIDFGGPFTEGKGLPAIKRIAEP